MSTVMDKISLVILTMVLENLIRSMMNWAKGDGENESDAKDVDGDTGDNAVGNIDHDSVGVEQTGESDAVDIDGSAAQIGSCDDEVGDA